MLRCNNQLIFKREIMTNKRPKHLKYLGHVQKRHNNENNTRGKCRRGKKRQEVLADMVFFRGGGIKTWTGFSMAGYCKDDGAVTKPYALFCSTY